MKGNTAVPLQRCMQGSSTQAFRRQHFLWVPLLNRKHSRSEPSSVAQAEGTSHPLCVPTQSFPYLHSLDPDWSTLHHLSVTLLFLTHMTGAEQAALKQRQTGIGGWRVPAKKTNQKSDERLSAALYLRAVQRLDHPQGALRRARLIGHLQVSLLELSVFHLQDVDPRRRTDG